MKGWRISFSGAKLGLERLLLRVTAGVRAFIVCRAGTPVVKLMPIVPPGRTTLTKRVHRRRLRGAKPFNLSTPASEQPL